MKKGFVFVLLFILFVQIGYNQTIYCVTNALDSGPGSLRDVIANAPSGSTIDLSSLSSQTITLNTPISIPKTLTINGYNTIISGNKATGIFNYTAPAGTLNNLTLTNGYNNVSGGGAINVSGTVLNVNNTTIVNNTVTGGGGANRGGGIFITNNATVNLYASTVSGNYAVGVEGGGIALNNNTNGVLNAYLSIISNNQTVGSGNGGGIDANTGGNIFLNSTLVANNSSSLGGGISSVGSLIQIINSTIYGNVSNGGGGGVNTGAVTLIQNSSFVANVAKGGDGGGFYSYGAQLTIASSLIVGNTASGVNTGGIYGSCINIQLDKTIFSNNMANGVPKDIQNGSCGINSTYGYNLFTTYTSASNFVFASGANTTGNGTISGFTSIVSNTLANNGGPLPTLAIPATSSAVGWGVWPAPAKVDGRGYIRSCANDAGAFQIQRFSSLNLTPRITTLCGQPLPLTLNAGLTSTSGSFLWFLNGNSIAGTNSPTYSITTYTPGTYKVRVLTSATCFQEDSVVVVATLPPTTISPRTSAQCVKNSVSLCNPSSVTLTATTTAPGLTFQWKYATIPSPGYGGLTTLTSGGTGPSLANINTPGMYQVIVSGLGCASVSDTISLKSVTATPINYSTCPAPNTTVGLSVTGSGKYKWYDAPTGGTVVGTGFNVTTKIPLTATTSPIIYYVTDTSSFSGSVGPTNPSGFTFANYGASSAVVNFTINQDFTITSMQVPIGFSYLPGSGTVMTLTVEVKNASGTSFTPAKTFVANALPVAGGTGNGLFTFSFTGFNVYAAWGSNLTMAANNLTFTNGAGGYVNWVSGGSASYPYTSTPAVITGASGPYGIVYGSFLNWQLQTGSQCARVPVKAEVICALSSDRLYMDGTSNHQSIRLQWHDPALNTAKEYIVERSLESNSFIPIYSSASGSTFQSYIDDNIKSGQYSYRIKRVGLDQIISYSNVKSFTIGNGNLDIALFPNPTSGDVSLKIYSGGYNTYQVMVLNALGQTYFTSNFENQGMESALSFPCTGWNKGIYILKVNTQKEEKIIKLILE